MPDYRDLCLYNEPRMNCVVMIFFFFFLLSVGCPSPHRRIRDIDLLSVVNLPKQETPSVLLNQMAFGLFNVYRNVYSHGYLMLNLFSLH